MKCKVKIPGKEPGWQEDCGEDATHGSYCEKHFNETDREFQDDLKYLEERLAKTQHAYSAFQKEISIEKDRV